MTTRNDLKFRNLTPDDDIDIVVSLMMDTDPFIYHDLFGSHENAVKVLPHMMKREIAIFSYDSFFVAERDGKIVGLAALYKYGDEWDSAAVRVAFIETDTPLPPSFDAVCSFFVKEHNYQHGIKACNICVAPDERGKGIGDYMVKQMIRAAGNSNIMLSVLASNTAALSLYRKNGFRILYEYDDYGGYGNPDVKCYKMIYLRLQ